MADPDGEKLEPDGVACLEYVAVILYSNDLTVFCLGFFALYKHCCVRRLSLAVVAARCECLGCGSGWKE